MPGPIHTTVVVVSCACGTFPLDKATHRTAATAWQAAADHVALTSRNGRPVCTPDMHRDTVPVALAPAVTDADREHTTRFGTPAVNFALIGA